MHAKKTFFLFTKFLIVILVHKFSFSQVSDLEKLGGLTLVKHQTCDVYYEKNLPKYLLNPLESLFSKKGYQLKKYKKGNKVIPNDFKIQVQKKSMGKLYKECFVEVKLFQIRGEYPSISDELIMQKSSTRKFPRHTLEGHERCRLAIKDMTYSLNPCQKNEK